MASRATLSSRAATRCYSPLLEEERGAVSRASHLSTILGDIDGSRRGTHETPHTSEPEVGRNRVVAVVRLAAGVAPRGVKPARGRSNSFP